MKIGLIGKPKCGKTTIFNALTGLNAEVAAYSTGKIEPNLGVVPVKDDRLEQLAKFYNPKKITHTQIEFIDFAGMKKSENAEIFSPASMALIKTTDALALVAANFQSDLVDNEESSIIDDIDDIEMEFILSDLSIAENRLDNIALSKKRGIKNQKILLEEKVLTKIMAHLNEYKPVRELKLTDEEAKAVRGFQFISRKPIMVIINSDEDNFGKNESLINRLSANYKTIEFAGRFEMELKDLSQEEALAFMEDLEIEQSAKQRLTEAAYELLGYISFFTAGKKEVRAWTLKKGSNALKAADTIHSDMAKGFIRAEVFAFEDLIKLGSVKKLREEGLIRLEGKDYIVKDGDVILFRFNV